MFHIAAALFFSLVFIGAAVAIQLTARRYWFEILAALRGELGLEVTPTARARAVRVQPMRPRSATA